jgi:hypothetical protein
VGSRRALAAVWRRKASPRARLWATHPRAQQGPPATARRSRSRAPREAGEVMDMPQIDSKKKKKKRSGKKKRPTAAILYATL